MGKILTHGRSIRQKGSKVVVEGDGEGAGKSERANESPGKNETIDDSKRIDTESKHTDHSKRIDTESKHTDQSERMDTESKHTDQSKRIDNESKHTDQSKRMDTEPKHNEQSTEQSTQQSSNPKHTDQNTQQSPNPLNPQNPPNPQHKRPFAPQKSTPHINVTTRIDYQPYLCKDYNETGYCGFGDSCIYVHDRGDYKASWELDLEWEQQQAKKQSVEQIEQIENPLSCPICSKELLKGSSVVKSGTCGHLFCEQCAIARFARDKKCAACGTVLDGRFQVTKVE